MGFAGGHGGSLRRRYVRDPLKKWGSEHAFDTGELLLLSFGVKLSSTSSSSSSSSKLEHFLDIYGFRILLSPLRRK
jgi:hypothetical protein